MSRRRVSCAELAILGFLNDHPTRRISYDAMSAELNFDRVTLINAISRLRLRGKLTIAEPGRGGRANTYALL